MQGREFDDFQVAANPGNRSVIIEYFIHLFILVILVMPAGG